MRRKVVLYNPRAVFWTMPLALLAVGSKLDRSKYEVAIIDGRIDSDEALVEQLKDAFCLGITVLTGAPIRDALRISQIAQQLRPDLPVIWGGWHPSLFPEMCVREAGITAAVIAQGEITFAEILDRLEAGSSLEGVKGCVYSEGDNIYVNQPRPMTDINALPEHDYSLVNVERYFHRKGRRQLDYISSQGCRFRCSFCADPAVYKRGWSGYEPQRLLSEVDMLWQKYRFSDLSFQDETYFTYPNRVNEVAEGFLKMGAGFSWFATMRADQGRRLDDGVLNTCARSGLRRVMIGLEAGSQQTIDWINKDIKIEDMWITAEKLVRHRIGAIINVIVGFPGESPESVAMTLDAARQLRELSSDFELAIFYYKPYPGNPIADILLKDGFLFPSTLSEWADFDYVGSENEWLTEEQKLEIERFKFYQHFAYDSKRSALRFPLRMISKWRVSRKQYQVPFEKVIIEKLRPGTALS